MEMASVGRLFQIRHEIEPPELAKVLEDSVAEPWWFLRSFNFFTMLD